MKIRNYIITQKKIQHNYKNKQHQIEEWDIFS